MNRNVRGNRTLISPTLIARAVIAYAGAMLVLPVASRASSLSDPAPASQTTIAASPADRAGSDAILIQAHARMLRPAPMPDRDVSAPALTNAALAAQADPSLGPDFFNPQTHFAGDGYEPGSTIEDDHNNRHTPGGGMSLSIPMQ